MKCAARNLQRETQIPQKLTLAGTPVACGSPAAYVQAIGSVGPRQV